MALFTNKQTEFPLKRRWQLAESMMDSARQIYHLVRDANNIKVRCRDDYLRRLHKQEKAIRLCKRLLGDYDIVRKTHTVSMFTLQELTLMTVDTLTFCRSWIRSDAKKYGYTAPNWIDDKTVEELDVEEMREAGMQIPVLNDAQLGEE